MISLELEINMNDVKVFGATVPRPSHLGAGEWMNMWEDIINQQGDTVNELRDRLWAAEHDLRKYRGDPDF